MARVPNELETGQLEQLEQLWAGLRAMALRALGDHDAAEDAAQEALARALSAIREGRFREGQSLGAFVRGIARHVIVDVFRARGRSSGGQGSPDHVVEDPSGDALAALVTAEEKARVRSALDGLSRADREVLVLSFFEGLTPAEIGERLHAPSERVRKRKSRALLRLRAAFHGIVADSHESE